MFRRVQKAMAVGLIQRLKAILFSEPKVIINLPEHYTLKEWKAQIEALQNHPLTQAKVINTEMLRAILSIMESMDGKVDRLHERVGDLEIKIKRTPRKTKSRPVRIASETEPKLRLNSKDKEVLAFIKIKEIQATDVAKQFKISRSNASLKLNKLHQMNFLEKRQDGKDVYYRKKK